MGRVGKLKAYTLRQGDTGQTVAQVQGAIGADQDGAFGPKTDQLVKAYQVRQGLTVDGIAGPQTLGRMGLDVVAGIDVSHHQGRIDWDYVGRAGVGFAYVKATEGRTHEDRRFSNNAKLARSVDLAVGAYHFSRPVTDADPDKPEKDARAEAHHFLRTYQAKPGDLRPALDLEAGFVQNDNYNARWALEWLAVVEKELATPICYCARWAVSRYFKDADAGLLAELAGYPVWWASYNEGSSPKRKPSRVWDSWEVWQYTGRGALPGVAGRVDLNWTAGGALERLRI
jgi:lysozyme